MKESEANQMRKEIIEILKPTQITAAVHQKNSILLAKFYEKSNAESFTYAFKQILEIVLLTDGDNAFIERTMDFIAMFCSVLKSHQNQVDIDETEDLVEHPLVSEIILHLLETSDIDKDTVRFRSCQLINKILDQLVGCEVSTILCEKLEERLLMRLQDSKNTIRQQGVLALHRLQDPENQQDVIIQQFIHLMNADSFAKVRLLCIENITARFDVISHIVTRIRDIDVNVRLAAYKRLSNIAKYLKISQKRLILHCGFLDKSEKVIDFVRNNLIPTWLQYYDGNILLLMKSVRLDADENDIKETETLFEKILNSFLKTKSLMELTKVLNLDNTKLLPIESLTWETAYYWKAYVQFLSKNEEFAEELDIVIPELVYFCKYVKEFCSTNQTGDTTVEFLEKQFILKQLFFIIKTYDFADVTNRQCLNSLVCNILEKVDLMSDVTEVIVGSLENSIPEINKRSQFVSEIISEIMFPMDPDESERKEQEREFQLSKLMVKINCLVENQTKAVAEENYTEAERLKNEIIETNTEYKKLKDSRNSPPQKVKKKCDTPTIIKYLDIAASLLLSAQITVLDSTLRALKDDVIQELLIHDNDNVRAKALRCYALCCIVDKSCAATGIHIFSTPIFAYQNGEECDTQTLITCIAAVVDLLRIYGPQLVAAPDDNVLSESMGEAHERVFAGGTSLTDLIQGLVDLMDDEQFEIEEKAVWGLCQLILSDRIHSSSLISRLVLKWCSPASEGDDRGKIRQLIGFTLQKIPPMTENTSQLEEAVLLTIKTLACAPRISPLADVNIDNIANFMIALCKTSPMGPHIQINLALKICSEIKDKPKSKLNLILSKMLLLLEPPEDKLIIKDLLKLCDQIRDVINDRLIVKNIVKFVSSLDTKNLDCSVVVEESENEIADT